MKATLEKISSIRQAVAVEAPAETVDKAYSKALDKIKKEAKIPGFREGKVPEQIIVKRFSKELAAEAVKELARITYPDAIKEVNARPISNPEVVPEGEITKGQDFKYKAYFEVYPEFTAENYEALKLEKEKISVSDEEVEAELLGLQRQLTQLEPAPDESIGPGMVATIDFTGTAAGKAFQGSKAENYVVEFGQGGLLEQFEVGIAGMKGSEEKNVSFMYPQDYFNKEIAGKLGEFRVKVRDVKRKIVPELNDEFAKELGKFTTLNEVRGDLKKRITEYKEILVRNKLKDSAVRRLIESHSNLEVPSVMIEAELENMLNQLKQRLEAQGQSIAKTGIDAAEFVRANEKEATERARGYMVVSAIAKQEKIELTDAEIEERLNQIAKQNRQPIQKIREHFEKNNLISSLRSQMIFEKTLDFVLDKAKISEVKAKIKK